MIKTGKHSLLGLVLQGTAIEWQYDVLCEDLGVRGAVCTQGLFLYSMLLHSK